MIRSTLLMACLALFSLRVSSADVNRPKPAEYSNEKVIFEDDFEEFDLEKWQHELTMGGGGNWEFQYYTNNRSNSYVRDSTLFLKPTLTADMIGEKNVLNDYTMEIWGASPADECTGNQYYGCSRTSNGVNIINPIQSARVRTSDSMNVKYGRVEVSARLPRGDWLWPAIWMLPRYNAYGQWPASGEIDIMESHGNAAGSAVGGVDTASSTLHFGPNWLTDPWDMTHGSRKLEGGKTFHDDFHVFGVKWDENGMYTYIDDDSNRLVEVDFKDKSMWEFGQFDELDFQNPWEGRPNSAPFDQKFFLVMNVAVGGTNDYWGKDGVDNKPWTSTDPDAPKKFWEARADWLPTWQQDVDNGENAALQVDWVKVWQ